MSAQSDLRQAIELMQDGQIETAVAMLNRLIDSAELDDKGRAAAYVWLAEAREDSAFKIRCLEQALARDPDNRQIQQGLHQLAAARPKPGQLPPTAPARRPADLEETPPVIGILGGLNGPASGVLRQPRRPNRHDWLCGWRRRSADGDAGCGAPTDRRGPPPLPDA